MTTKTCSMVIACLLAIYALAGDGASKEKKKESYDSVVRISYQLVQIDVIVTDKAGKAVAGLKREDFELYDNNKLQDISHFAYETTRARAVGEDIEEAPVLPRAITAAEVKRVLAFVVDTLHMKPENVYRTRQMLQN